MKNADAVASGDSGRRGDFGAFASHQISLFLNNNNSYNFIPIMLV